MTNSKGHCCHLWTAKTLGQWALLLASPLSLLAYSLYPDGTADKKAYEQLMSSGYCDDKEVEEHTCCQRRTNVRKDILWCQEGGREHLTLDCEKAQLQWQLQKGETKAVEHMQNMHAEAHTDSLSMRSDVADYDGKKIFLEGNVFVEHSVGLLYAQQATLYRDDKVKKLAPARILLNDNVRMKLRDGAILQCSSADIDCKNSSATFHSADTPIRFEDERGELLSDNALLVYRVEDGHYTPVRLILDDNVQIINRLAAKEEDKSSFKQYILADHVEYDFNSRQMDFSSKEEKQRVLFFDKINNLQISAPKVMITRSGKQNKEEIKGFGDVRLTLLECELEEMQKRFFTGNTHE